MIAVDTNILVYAHRKDSPRHAAAHPALNDLVRGPSEVGLPWPVIHEFLAVVTHPRIYRDPSSPEAALQAIDALLEAGVRPLAEGPRHLTRLGELLAGGQVVGARVHDARVAAICLAHGVEALWSADRDFSWFPTLRVINPLVG